MPKAKIVGQFFLVIQGAPRIRAQWHDIETLRDCDYARQVLPARLIEYQRGNYQSASKRFTEFRIVRREIADREYQPNVGGSTS